MKEFDSKRNSLFRTKILGRYNSQIIYLIYIFFSGE